MRAHNGPGGLVDPMARQRRYSLPMCSGDGCRQGRDPCRTPDACRVSAENADSEFGALEGVVRGGRYILGCWAVIAVTAAAAYLIWW